MSDLKNKVQQIVNSGKCMGLMMLKNELKISELEVINNLEEKDKIVLNSTYFDKVWEFLTSFDKLTLFIEKEGNIFEINTKVGPGKEGMGYFNLFAKDCLNGHLVKNSVSNIALIKLPFLHLVSYQITFLNAQGNSIYNFYLARYEHKHLLSDIEKFEMFVNEVKN